MLSSLARIAAVAFCLLALVIGAPPVLAESSGDVVIEMPEALADALSSGSKRLEQDALELIEGFGDGGQIDAAGLALSVVTDRAAARATALRRFLALDLDGDLAVSAEEAAQATSVLAAKSRGRLMALVAAADLDGDRSLALIELRLAGEAAALRAVSEERAAERLALMAFDQDRDGWLTREELRAVLSAASSTQPPGRAPALAEDGI